MTILVDGYVAMWFATSTRFLTNLFHEPDNMLPIVNSGNIGIRTKEWEQDRFSNCFPRSDVVLTTPILTGVLNILNQRLLKVYS